MLFINININSENKEIYTRYRFLCVTWVLLELHLFLGYETCVEIRTVGVGLLLLLT